MVKAREFEDAVLSPNLGLYLDRPPYAVPLRGLQDGLNFRIKEGKIDNLNLGWDLFGLFNALSGPVTLIDNFFLRSGGQLLIFGTTKDLYSYNEGIEKVTFLTPRYEAGTADPTNGSAVVVGGTAWNTNLSAGDFMFFGATGETDPDATGEGGWYEILTVDGAAQVTLTANYTGSGGAQAYTARKVFTGTIFDWWDTETFYDAQPSDEDLWYATNGVDDIVKWDGSATQVTVTGLGFTAKRIAKFKNMMIYANVTEGSGEVKPNTIKNSDLTKPEEMAAGLAGEFIVHDGVDPVDGLYTLGDTLMLYGSRSGIVTQFVGDPLVFIFRVGVVGIGPLAGRLVADFGDFHEFVAADSQYVFDGVTLRESGKHVWREVLRQRDPNRTGLSFSHFDEENGDLIWVLPLTTDPNTGSDQTPRIGYPEHYLEEVGPRDPTPYSKREVPFTVSGFFERQTTLTWDQLTDAWETYDFKWNDMFFQAAFPFNLFGSEDGKIYTLNTSSSGDGTALSSFVRFGRRPLGDGRQRNLLARLYPFAEKFEGSLDATIHLSDHAMGPSTAVGPFSFDTTLPEGGHFVSIFRRARFAEVEFGVDGSSVQQWGIAGYDWDIRRGGFR
jgi:hypothetical protein